MGRQNAAPDRDRLRALYLLKLDQTAGTHSMDDAFRDTEGKPGFNFADRNWPHG